MCDILCVKVMKNTEAVVLKHELYYSDVHPAKTKYSDVSTIFLIGEVDNEKIPLIGTCDVTISACDKVHKDFEGFAKGAEGWKYEWKLNNLQKRRISDIRGCIKPSSPGGVNDIKLITNLQKMGYISSNNLDKSALGGAIGNNIFISNIKENDELINKDTSLLITKVQRQPLKNRYSVGRIVQIKNKCGKGSRDGIIEKIEEKVEDDILYDQKLTIRIDNEKKLYLASYLNAIRKNEAV